MADISGLTNLQATEPLDWEGYADAQESKPIPPAGKYTFRVAPQVTFPPAKSGYLQAQIDPVIEAPSHAGYVVKAAKVSAKPFKRGDKTVSFAGDLIRAVGLPIRPSGDPQEVANALEQTAGLTFEGIADWEAQSGDFRVKGMANFPKDPVTGLHTPWVVKVDAAGQPVIDPVTNEPEQVRAYFRIVKYLPKGGAR